MSFILKKGDSGKRVREVQQLLNENGYWDFHTITDFFGNVTKESVKNFQKKNGLTVDGIVGPNTWKALSDYDKHDNITPVNQNVSDDEDHSDPEEEMVVAKVSDEIMPTAPNIIELVKLITQSNITRNVTRLVYHCTATQQNASVQAIVNYWKNNLGWINPGYHIIIKPDGSWTYLQDFNRPSNGVRGINATSIHISYIGGIDKNGRAIDNRTPEQIEVMEVAYWLFKDKIKDLTFHGHYEFSNKACPSFNVEKWMEEIKE